MDKYTKFILTVIAVAMIGILFKGQITKPAYAGGSEGVCHAGYLFVVHYDGGMVQFFEERNGKSLPAKC